HEYSAIRLQGNAIEIRAVPAFEPEAQRSGHTVGEAPCLEDQLGGGRPCLPVEGLSVHQDLGEYGVAEIAEGEAGPGVAQSPAFGRGDFEPGCGALVGDGPGRDAQYRAGRGVAIGSQGIPGFRRNRKVFGP
ncbi:hypothetical protein RZS08_25325, partial [Arthrospira platensis SPKY1]|nr:hypothetical protein [Arthrospira platensis SPKY1]